MAESDAMCSSCASIIRQRGKILEAKKAWKRNLQNLCYELNATLQIRRLNQISTQIGIKKGKQNLIKMTLNS